MLLIDQIVPIHHLTLNKDHKRDHLFEVVEKLQILQKPFKMPKLVVLSSDFITSNYISCQLNMAGIYSVAVHSLKTNEANEEIKNYFYQNEIKVLVTDLRDIDLKENSFQYVINYDMFIPNMLWYQRNKCDDVFHNQHGLSFLQKSFLKNVKTIF